MNQRINQNRPINQPINQNRNKPKISKTVKLVYKHNPSTPDRFRRKNIHKAYMKHIHHLLGYKKYINTDELYDLLQRTYIKATDGKLYPFNHTKKQYKRYLQKLNNGIMINKINN
jgi:hypothetical protein